MNKELNTLVSAGHGAWMAEFVHDVFGQGIWKYQSNSCEMFFFMKGLIYLNTKSDLRYEVAFRDIQEVKSHLSAHVISSLYRATESENLIPMRLITHEKSLDLDIPLIIYSGALITIQELRAESKRSASAPSERPQQ